VGRIGRLTSGAAAVVVLVVGGASPASAEPQRTLSIDPAGDPAGDLGASPTVNGSFKGASIVLNVEKISGVDLRVSPTGPTGGGVVTRNGCEVASSGGCNTSEIAFSWAVPSLPYNGPYVVEATGRYCDPLLCLNPESASAAPIEFRLGADPSAPTDLRSEPGDERTVNVSWSRNGEPDLLYYALFRKDPGGDFRRLGADIRQPESGRPTFTDTSVSGTNGGDFVYKVFAVRRGYTGDATTTRISRASAERTTTVAAPPTTTTPGNDPNAPTTVPAGQGVDISSFLSGQPGSLPTPSPIFLDLPDTGFGETLPFGSLPDEAEPGEEDAVLPTSPRQRAIADFKRNRPLIPVAAGAILLVLAGHIRLLNVRTKEPAPAKPPPGTYVARALEAARANRIPVDVAAAVANGGHHRAPPGPADDLAELPVWAEFEPVSALGLLDELYPEPADDDRPFTNGHATDERRQFELFAPDAQVAAAPVAEVVPVPAADAAWEREPEPEPAWEPEPEPAWEPETEAAWEPEPWEPEPREPETGAAWEPEPWEPEPSYATASVAPASVASVAPASGARDHGVQGGGADPEPDRVSRGARAPRPARASKPARPRKPARTTAATAAPAQAPAPAPEPAPDVDVDFGPEPDPQVLYDFDGESEWSSQPEVFVSPRR
jgi:hypothetical protein